MSNGNGNDKKFPATDRRINYLRQEIYNYDKYLRNPQSQDMASSAKWAIDVDDHQRELDEIMYLRDFAEKANQPTGIKVWQAIGLAAYTTISLAIAVMAFWLIVIR